MTVEECRLTNYPSVYSMVGNGGVPRHFVWMFFRKYYSEGERRIFVVNINISVNRWRKLKDSVLREDCTKCLVIFKPQDTEKLKYSLNLSVLAKRVML
jgi:hypothetical protein